MTYVINAIEGTREILAVITAPTASAARQIFSARHPLATSIRVRAYRG